MKERLTLEDKEAQDLYLILIDWVDLNQKLYRKIPEAKTKLMETEKTMIKQLGSWLK